jgi:hypothetical protein
LLRVRETMLLQIFIKLLQAKEIEEMLNKTNFDIKE